MSNAQTLSHSQLEGMQYEAYVAGVDKPYQAMIDAGTSPRLALMLAMQKFPGTKGTDATFNKLQREQMTHDYTEDDRERIVRIARRAGINPTGKTYNGQLGRYNDPKAWVSDTHDVRKTAQEKGLSLRGQVNVENEPRPITTKRLSDQLIAETEQEYLAADPALRQKVAKNKSARHALREKIIEKHGRKVK